jgi:eukaryotic-like serine/threonine-protein kinase
MNGSGSRLPPRREMDVRSTGANEIVTDPERPAPPEDSNPYLAGEVIGDRYRLVSELGRGGMGVVWVAHALSLGVDVAVKLIRVSVAGPAVAARMAREAHAAARVGHPALVRVFDFGWTNRADPFLVMELVQGETLCAILGREPCMEAVRAVQMILPVADGLRLAHQHSIIHRDIKPENILIATDALGRIQPKLLDFGIAKVGPTNTDLRLTQIGVALGSPEYMSPEQAQGIEDVDERTDVWSLAVVLYEMITGGIPFVQDNYNALMQSIIHDSPAPIPDLVACDPALWQLIERGLCKDREERWSSMTELGEALALWLYEHGVKEDISGNSIRAVWLDGTVSGVKHAAISARPDPLPFPSPPPKVSPAQSAALTPTIEAVVRKRRNAARVDTQRQIRLIAVAAILGGALLGGLLTATLANGGSPAESRIGVPFSHESVLLPNAVGSMVSAAASELQIRVHRTTNAGQDSQTRAAVADPSRSASVGSKSTNPTRARGRTEKRSAKSPRDFGF